MAGGALKPVRPHRQREHFIRFEFGNRCDQTMLNNSHLRYPSEVSYEKV